MAERKWFQTWEGFFSCPALLVIAFIDVDDGGFGTALLDSDWGQHMHSGVDNYLAIILKK